MFNSKSESLLVCSIESMSACYFVCDDFFACPVIRTSSYKQKFFFHSLTIESRFAFDHQMRFNTLNTKLFVCVCVQGLLTIAKCGEYAHTKPG